jgi:hypothetical protein
MIRSALIGLGILLIAACNSSPSQTTDNTVGGPGVVSSAKAPLQKGTSTLTLDWGPKAAGQFAIADVLSYGGSNPTISAPAGWQLIRDDSTKTTRQSLYWHAIQPSDGSTATWTFSEPVDAQGAVVLLDNVASAAPVDMSSGNTSDTHGPVTAKSVATTSDGDLILNFTATDFGAYRPTSCGKCDGLNPKLPPNVSVVLNHETTALEYWILANYKTQAGDTEPQTSEAPQFFNWVAAQVAIKRAVSSPATPSS